MIRWIERDVFCVSSFSYLLEYGWLVLNPSDSMNSLLLSKGGWAQLFVTSQWLVLCALLLGLLLDDFLKRFAITCQFYFMGKKRMLLESLWPLTIIFLLMLAGTTRSSWYVPVPIDFLFTTGFKNITGCQDSFKWVRRVLTGSQVKVYYSYRKRTIMVISNA